jgi:rhomboid family protein
VVVLTPWVVRLLVLNVGVFLLEQYVPGVAEQLALVPAHLDTHPWTIITYMFAHASFSHLLFNMLGLYFFGPRVEMVIGSKRFFALYMTSGFAGALLWLATSFSSPERGMVGASAALFGVFYAFARFWPRERILVWFVLPIQARTFVIVMTVLSLYGGMGGRFEPNVAHFAHLGGFVGGWLFFRWTTRGLRVAGGGDRTAAGRMSRSTGGGGTVDLQRWRQASRETMHPVNRDEFDRLVTKAEASGVASLTPDERAFLDRMSPPPA